jgi:hypothetical protein
VKYSVLAYISTGGEPGQRQKHASVNALVAHKESTASATTSQSREQQAADCFFTSYIHTASLSHCQSRTDKMIFLVDLAVCFFWWSVFKIWLVLVKIFLNIVPMFGLKQAVLQEFEKRGIAVSFDRAQAGKYDKTKYKCELVVHNDEFFRKIAFNDCLGIGEAYMDGWVDCDDISEFTNCSLKIPMTITHYLAGPYLQKLVFCDFEHTKVCLPTKVLTFFTLLFQILLNFPGTIKRWASSLFVSPRNTTIWETICMA